MVNGKDTRPGEYSFHTQVGCCSGALIAPDVVLTASHVVSEEEGSRGMTVIVGAYYSTLASAIAAAVFPTIHKNNSSSITPIATTYEGGEVRKVIRAIRHPNYNGIHNDFSLLFLDRPAIQAKPISINRSPHIPHPYQQLTLLGTGTLNLSTSVRSDVLQETTSRYVPNEECRKAYDPKRGILYSGGFLDETNLCSKGYGDGCSMDSGGPVLLTQDDDDKDYNTGDGRQLLVGLISYGVDCNDPTYPAVNARVSSVHEWIDDMVCQYSQATLTSTILDLDCSFWSQPLITTSNSSLVSSTTSTGLSTTSVLGELLKPSFRTPGPREQDEEGSSVWSREGWSSYNRKLVSLVVVLGFALFVMTLHMVVEGTVTRPRSTTPVDENSLGASQDLEGNIALQGTEEERHLLLTKQQPRYL